MDVPHWIKSSANAWVWPVVLCTALAVLYPACLVIYRLYFSPLARFPGPKIAAATSWYEFYFDVVKSGFYIYEVEKMHAKYGPIVRVTPHELSIHDPEFYEKLYVPGNQRKTNNYNQFVKGIDLEGSHFLTVDHDLHRRRRKVLDPFFSRLGIRKLEPLLAMLVTRFERRLKACKGDIIRLDHAFVAFSGDVIRSITCEGVDFFMDDPDFSSAWFELLLTVVKSVPLFTAFPWLIHLVSMVPEDVLARIYPRGQEFVKFKDMARSHILQAKRDKEIAREKNQETVDGNSVFRSVINSDMPESELSTDRLTKEAQVLFGAGTATTARTLDFITFYVISESHIRERLAAELAEPMKGFPEKFPPLTELEKLPYLQAVVNEGLRLSFGVMHRLPHCYPDTAIQYKEWTIPPNTPIGMSAYLNHTDPVAFKDPFKFNPDRWLGDVDPRMHKYFIPFSRGSRSCLGMNLGKTEINFMLAALFRPGGPSMKLYETDESDVKQLHDFMLPLPKLDTKGVRAIVS